MKIYTPANQTGSIPLVARRFFALIGSLVNLLVGLTFALWTLAAGANLIAQAFAGVDVPLARLVLDRVASDGVVGVIIPVLAFDLWRRAQIDRIDLAQVELTRELVLKHREDEPQRVRAIVAAMRQRGEL